MLKNPKFWIIIMAPLYQRYFIVLLLLLAFAGRVAVYAIPVQKMSKDLIQKNSSAESEKSESSEKQNQLEDKVKLADLHLNNITNFDFASSGNANQQSFSGNFLLAYCHLQIPEQPPK